MIEWLFEWRRRSLLRKQARRQQARARAVWDRPARLTTMERMAATAALLRACQPRETHRERW